MTIVFNLFFLLVFFSTDSVIIIWKKKNNPDIFDAENENKEHWTCVRMLRLHINDVCDLSWSPDSQYLISGSVDNTAVLWNVNSGRTVVFCFHYVLSYVSITGFLTFLCL